MSISNLSEPTVEEETKIEDIADDLYNRIAEETERVLKSQLQALGVDIEDHDLISDKCQKRFYPLDDLALATYEYNEVKILGVRISENRMAIEFDVPKIPPRKSVEEVELEGFLNNDEDDDTFLLKESLKTETQKPRCGNCVHWRGGWINIGEPRRRCLTPLEEGKTFVNITGTTKFNDYCTRHKPINPETQNKGEVQDV